MSQPTVVTTRVTVKFDVDRSAPPPDETMRAALRALRALEIDAPTVDVAELYAACLVEVLKRAGS